MQNGRLFPDDIFKYIFLNENYCISIQILLKSFLESPVSKTLALV